MINWVLDTRGEDMHVEASTSKKHEVKDEEKVASKPSTKGKERFKSN
jgi:hypothetical protein